MRRLILDPVLIFFALGGMLFVAYAMLDRESTTAVVLSEGSRALLISEWEMLTGRSAEPSDVARIVNDYYQRELLFREGLAAELYLSDPSVRELIIELMQQRVVGEIVEPSAKDLVNFYTDNIERYYSEATISFSQKLFPTEPQDPRGQLATMNSAAAESGVEPWQGKDFPRYGISMVRGLFGQPILETLQRVPVGDWQGPYETRQGWHYFRVEERQAPVLLPFERVRGQVLADYQAAAVAEAVAQFARTQEPRYPLEISP